ncbi:MAG: hypothetical protein LBE91_14730 [Tannerella sp.]|jgi:uncharacterized protein with PQ loop repeat|nr:hypothetical protein [Tannerella sp.]
MKGIFAFIIGSLGSLASLITILQYFGFGLSQLKSKKSKRVIFGCVVICTISLLGYWQHTEQENQKISIEKNTEKVKSDILRNDAKETSSAIIISGWENSGDYIGYLTQIVGFYGRHKDKYNLEYETNKIQLDDYITFFKYKRDKNEFIFSSEWDNLKGLVTSGRDNLSKISISKE